MDGAKMMTDTAGHREVCSRQASGVGRSVSEKRRGPRWNENPGESRYVVA
jgi:hypothetical protein